MMTGDERGGGDDHDRVDADHGARHGEPQQRAVGGPAEVIEAVIEDRDRDRDGQRQQDHAEKPAGNAVGEKDDEQNESWRAGSHGEKQQLLADERPAASPSSDEPGDRPGRSRHGEQDPGGTQHPGYVPKASRQAERASPASQPVLIGMRADDVAEKQAGHGRDGGPGQPAPPRSGQAAVGKHDGHADYCDQQPGRLETWPDGGQVAGPGDRPRGGDHAVDPGFGERLADPHRDRSRQQQPAHTVSRHREGDDRADHGDRRERERERQRVGEDGSAGTVVNGRDG